MSDGMKMGKNIKTTPAQKALETMDRNTLLTVSPFHLTNVDDTGRSEALKTFAVDVLSAQKAFCTAVGISPTRDVEVTIEGSLFEAFIVARDEAYRALKTGQENDHTAAAMAKLAAVTMVASVSGASEPILM